MRDSSTFYLLEPHNPVLDQYRDLFTQLRNQDTHTLDLVLPFCDVQAGKVGTVQQLLMALQHHPHLIGKMLFSVNLNFTETENSNEYIPETQWKTQPAYYTWFQKLVEVPFILFFIADEDARFYALAADILLQEEVDAVTDKSDGRTCVTFTREQTAKLEERLFEACCSLLLYCSGSGFNPRIYIEGVMALLNASFKYDDVENGYNKLVDKGAFSLVRKND